MTYFNAIKFIKNAPNVAPAQSSAAQRVSMLCAALGNPQRRLKFIRLAGSNGKTVCAEMLISILNKAGISNGCLAMPIQSEIRDNVKINGESISIKETVSYVEQICLAVSQINAEQTDGIVFRPTAHEILLCISLLAFTEHSCSICIIESDHNGEDNSRFVISPFAAIICGCIPSDEKNEISKIRSYIQRGVREIISAPQDSDAYKIISDTCAAVNCRLTIPARNNFKILSLNLGGTKFSYKGNEYSLRLCGKFETTNALVAIESSEMLSRCGYKINVDHIKEGLSSVLAPCKFEILSLSPTIIADSTHTSIAIAEVCNSLLEFKSITGTNIRLCLPEGDLIEEYIDILTARGYSIQKITALEDTTSEEKSEYSLPVSLCRTVKATVKDMLSGLRGDDILLISGDSKFTTKLRYELLITLGF